MSVDELQNIGISRMNATEIADFLATQQVAILALPSEPVPYVVPLAYGYDGESMLYFTYVLGAESRKETLSEQAELARVLVFSADSMFHWESVQLTGTIEAVPDEDLDVSHLDDAWRPDIFDRADLSEGSRVYQFQIQDQSGIKHTGLPPGFEE